MIAPDDMRISRTRVYLHSCGLLTHDTISIFRSLYIRNIWACEDSSPALADLQIDPLTVLKARWYQNYVTAVGVSLAMPVTIDV